MPLVSLQFLRGIAALMVLCVHLQLQSERLGAAGDWPSWLNAGVDIFFVLSGFLMWDTTAGRSIGPLAFYRRRIARIVPLYWLLTSAVLAVVLLAPRLLQSTSFDWLNVAGSYLFFFAPTTDGRMVPVLVPGWTLNYEMRFYAIFGAALLLAPRWRFIATAGAIAALMALASATPTLGRWLAPEGSSLMLEFVFGMGLAVVWRRLPAGGKALHGWGLLALGLAGLVASAWLPQGAPRALEFGFPALLVVAGALLVERAGALPAVPGLRWLGDISYSLYLSHPIVLSAAAQVWRKLGGSVTTSGLAVFCLLATTLSVAVAGGVYRCIEQPLNRRFGARTGARATA